ncbi:MAG TPA: biotin/lipoyl-containing protein [Bdellovibrionota bacterium]|jgi:biotin carboxyl carrier protein
MSDRSYIPPGGECLSVRRTPEGELDVRDGKGQGTKVSIDCQSQRIDHQTQRIIRKKPDGSRQLFWIFESRGKRVLSWPGGSLELEALSMLEGSKSGGGKLKPLKLTMPGKVVAVKVKEGEIVEAEQGLVIVEAMKMENILLAPAKARIGKVHVKAGDRLESGAILITFEPLDGLEDGGVL